MPDELEDDIHATFIDLNDSTSSLHLPQLVLPDTPHEQIDPRKASQGYGSEPAGMNSFLSFTPGVSPADSPIIALPSQHFLRSPEPAVEEGTSRHLEAEENQFEKGMVSAQAVASIERPPESANWREAVDDFIGKSSTS